MKKNLFLEMLGTSDYTYDPFHYVPGFEYAGGKGDPQCVTGTVGDLHKWKAFDCKDNAMALCQRFHGRYDILKR